MRRLGCLFVCFLGIACSDEEIGKVGSAIKVEPASIELGDTPVGVLKKFEVTITNVGPVVLAVNSVGLVEETGVPFSLDLSAVAPNDAPFTLAPGATSVIEVRHIPRDRVLDSGVLRIVSDDPDNGTIEVPIDQTGAGAPEILVVPDVDQADAEADTPGGISSSVQEIAFGQVPIGVRRSIVVFVVNAGDGNIPLEITDISITGAVSADNLTIEATPDPEDSSVLLPLLGVKSRASTVRSLRLSVNWQPPASGAGLQAVLRISSSDPVKPALDIPITGGNNTIDPPIIRLLPANGLTFPATPVGQSATMMFTAYNDGAATLIIEPPAIAGDPAGAYFLVETPAQITLEPGFSHNYSVRYTPPTGVMHMGSVVITSNDPANPVINYPLGGNSSMMCTPSLPDPGEPMNDDCMTAIDRGSFALDINTQQDVNWTDSMLFAAGDSDWHRTNLSVVAGCDLTGYDLDANVILPGGEQAEVCLEVGDCGTPFRRVCGMGSTGILLSPFTAGPEACNMFNNNLPVRVSVRHTAGDLTCTSYTLHFSAR